MNFDIAYKKMFFNVYFLNKTKFGVWIIIKVLYDSPYNISSACIITDKP